MSLIITDNTRIIKITSFDMLSMSNYQSDTIYACTDTKKLYKTQTLRSCIELTDVQNIFTELERISSIVPVNNRFYYVWETNSLWIYTNNTWVLKLGSYTPSYSAVNYDNSNGFDPIYTQVLDNNGLLKDGSVVVRDYNRIIKGKLYIDSLNNNLNISSFLGGGIKFLPSGESNNYFYIDNDDITFTGPESNKTFKLSGDYYTEKSGNTYKVWTEEDFTFDNLKRKIGVDINSIIRDLEGYYINESGKIIIKCGDYYKDEYDNKYVYDEELHVWKDYNGNVVSFDNLTKKLYDIDVSYLGGKKYDQYSLVGHKHTYEDVLVDNKNIKIYFEDYIKDRFYHSEHKGISVSDSNKKYIFSIIDKQLKLTGGVSGTATLSYADKSSFEMNVTVLPDKHQHTLCEEQISGFTQFANSVLSKDEFGVFYKYLFGSVYNENSIDLDSSPLIVSSPSANKLLLLDSQGNLPTNITGTSEITKSLSKDISITILDNQDNPSISLKINKDLSDCEASINIEPYTHDHTQYALSSSIGSPSLISVGEAINNKEYRKLGIAPLDVNGKVPMSYLPSSVLGALQFQTSFDPSLGYPVHEDTSSSTGYKDQNGKDFELLKGQYWVAISDSSKNNTIDGQEYLTGDWAIFDGTDWVYLDNSGCVESVNGQSGRVVINTDTINAINADMIYDPSNPRDNTILLLNVKVDGEGNLSKNLDCDILGKSNESNLSYASYSLTHNIFLNLTGNITGSISLDTSLDSSGKPIVNNTSLSIPYIDGGSI